MAAIGALYIFVANTIIRSAYVNQNFADVKAAYNAHDAAMAAVHGVVADQTTAVGANTTTGSHAVFCTAGGITITLTTANAAVDGTVIMVKDVSGTAGSSPITIDTEGAELIDSVASVQIVDDNGWMVFRVKTGHFKVLGAS